MTTTISFNRPTKDLLSLNSRQHWARRAADMKTWRQTAAAHGRALRGAAHPPAMICITYDVHDSRRRDPSNQIGHKPIVDGLVDAGFWADDTPEFVTICEPQFRVTPRKSALMVTVELRPR